MPVHTVCWMVHLHQGSLADDVEKEVTLPFKLVLVKYIDTYFVIKHVWFRCCSLLCLRVVCCDLTCITPQVINCIDVLLWRLAGSKGFLQNAFRLMAELMM